MNLVISVIAQCLLISTTKISEVYNRAIIGGEVALGGEFPFMAAIGWPTDSELVYDFRCGGFFFVHNRVVTAAHCVRSRKNPPAIVRPGGGNLTDTTDPNLPIAEIVLHPSYTIKQSYNDIAILKLSKNSPYVGAKLWTSSEIRFTKAIAIGYGRTQFGGESSDALQKVSLLLRSNTYCSRFYKPDRKLEEGIIDSQLCAGDIFKDTCQGDSGGPLLVRINYVYYVVGITSFGAACALDVPSVYTRISSYVSWIESI